MDNLKYVKQVLNDLNDENDELFQMKKEYELSEEHEKEIAKYLTDVAEEFNAKGKFLTYPEWRTILINTIELSIDEEFFKADQDNYSKNFIENCVKQAIMSSGVFKHPYDSTTGNIRFRNDDDDYVYDYQDDDYDDYQDDDYDDYQDDDYDDYGDDNIGPR